MKVDTLAQKIVDNISSAIGAIPRTLNFDVDLGGGKKSPKRRAGAKKPRTQSAKAKARSARKSVAKSARKGQRKTKLRLVKGAKAVKPRARRSRSKPKAA